MFDPLGEEEIVAGQLSQRDGITAYDVWTKSPRPARLVKTPCIMMCPPGHNCVLSNQRFFRSDASFSKRLRVQLSL